MHGTKAERAEARRRAAILAAVEVENWRDREGKARPTPERKRRGNLALHDGDDAGTRHAVDEGATLLDRLRIAALITDLQCQAGSTLAELLERTRLGSAPRSCLDFTPRGRDDERPSSHAELRDLAERAALRRITGAPVWDLLRATCDEDRGPTDRRGLEQLRGGLNRVAAYWRLG